jgi:hypothetical protein
MPPTAEPPPPPSDLVVESHRADMLAAQLQYFVDLLKRMQGQNMQMEHNAKELSAYWASYVLGLGVAK